jgi:hypothetical protein
MSYDFMMMRPRVGRESEIESLEDLGEHTLQRQDPAALVEALSSLFPQIEWRKEDSGGWFGSLKGGDSWYEFRIEAAADYAWSICTSHRAGTRNLVPVVCDRLGLLAFDGQANLLIWPAVSGE